MTNNANSQIPAPAGTNANGEPYWIINGQQITWAQMQQVIWQQMQKQKAFTNSGVESIPNFNSIDQLLDAVVKPDAVDKVTSPERIQVREKLDTRIETNTQNKVNQSIAIKKEEKPKTSKSSVVGDSHKDQKTKSIFSDVEQMLEFYNQNQNKAKKPNPKDADDYLVVLVERLLRMMSAATN